MRGRTIQVWVLSLAALVGGVGVAMAANASMSSGSSTVNTVRNAKFGMILVSSSGMTLYAPSSKSVGACSGACAKIWPPLLVKGTAKPTVGAGAAASLIRTTMRSGGAEQVTYGGYPLYAYVGDRKPGQVSGQGFQGKWYVVSAKGALIKHAVTSSSPATTTTKSAWG
jgi:predicted lipoprotein with Yx(FWY)xxD motif